jgi:hypothetical protein
MVVASHYHQSALSVRSFSVSDFSELLDALYNKQASKQASKQAIYI